MWQGYASDLSHTLTEALLAGHSTANLQVSAGVTVSVSFLNMLQRNTATGWQRDVRCVSTARGYECSDMWQWQDPGKGSWELFEAGTGRLLEVCSILAHSPVSITLGGIPYKADVTAMHLKQDTVAPPPAPLPIPIRRLTPSSLPTWEWQNEHNVWVAYPSALVNRFEAARDSGDSTCSFRIAGRGYQLHLDSMEQENCSSGVIRKVQRSVAHGSAQSAPGAWRREAGCSLYHIHRHCSLPCLGHYTLLCWSRTAGTADQWCASTADQWRASTADQWRANIVHVGTADHAFLACCLVHV